MLTWQVEQLDSCLLSNVLFEEVIPRIDVLVRDDNAGALAIAMQLWLSSNTFEITRELFNFKLNPLATAKAILRTGNKVFIASANATYSASAVDKVARGCSLDAQCTGQ